MRRLNSGSEIWQVSHHRSGVITVIYWVSYISADKFSETSELRHSPMI